MKGIIKVALLSPSPLGGQWINGWVSAPFYRKIALCQARGFIFMLFMVSNCYAYECTQMVQAVDRHMHAAVRSTPRTYFYLHQRVVASWLADTLSRFPTLSPNANGFAVGPHPTAPAGSAQDGVRAVRVPRQDHRALP